MHVTRSVWRIAGEATPLVIGYAVMELLAGGLLGSMTDYIGMLPGLFVLIPALLDMRGNIGSAFGARLNSGLHLGYIKPGKMTKGLKTNIYSTLILSLLMSIILSFFASFTCYLSGISSISFLAFALISVITGFSSGFLLIFLAIFISGLSYRKGLDPDDVTSPTIGAAGDIITVVCLFLTVRLVLGLGI
jgi:mgtE-like transporter